MVFEHIFFHFSQGSVLLVHTGDNRPVLFPNDGRVDTFAAMAFHGPGYRNDGHGGPQQEWKCRGKKSSGSGTVRAGFSGHGGTTWVTQKGISISEEQENNLSPVNVVVCWEGQGAGAPEIDYRVLSYSRL